MLKGHSKTTEPLRGERGFVKKPRKNTQGGGGLSKKPRGYFSWRKLCFSNELRRKTPEVLSILFLLFLSSKF